MIKIVHVITGLGVGGAETMLAKLVSGMDKSEFHPIVVSLQDAGPIGERIEKAGVQVRACAMTAERPDPGVIMRLAGMIRQDRPHIVQTWLYHADLIGGIACKMAGRASLLWNIRHSHLDPATIKRSTIRIGRACAKLSHLLPQSIVCCSEAGRQVHTDLGYSASKMVVIPNGFDLSEFTPNKGARAEIRSELAIPDGALAGGIIGRYHPMKDHHGLVSAAKLVIEAVPNAHFVLCGDGVDGTNAELTSWIDAAGIGANVRLLGRRNDLARIYAAMDLVILGSAYGEGFPNVIGEAMACGVPCVVTDVGDAAYIVGDTGAVVSPGDPGALANAVRAMMDLTADERAALGERARKRVSEEFDILEIVKRYEDLYRGVVDAHRK